MDGITPVAKVPQIQMTNDRPRNVFQKMPMAKGEKHCAVCANYQRAKRECLNCENRSNFKERT